MNPTPTDPHIGRTISQYDVVARLGGGGMGVVYKATDTKLGRTVALKFLPPQWSHDESAKQRFLREAQAASATNHRNICVIHDIDQTDDGQLFIVMAYYEGQTLKQKLDAGPLPVAEAIEIATEIAEGLAKAHSLGVVHRDIKPGNLIVTDDGVKVLDFGLATFADAVKLTLEGSTIGTAAYMSPEQVRGEEADARSDIWALGVVMYEMLTGEVPFKGGYGEAIFHAIKFEPLPPLSRTDRDIPDVLERIVLRALEKDPAGRYQSARELARDLRLLQGRTVPLDLRTEALPDMAGAKLPALTFWQRVRREVTIGRAAAAVVVLGLAGVGSYRYLTRPVVRIRVAIAPMANHTGEPALDDYRLALTEALIDELSDSPNIRVISYPRLVETVRKFIADDSASGSEAIQSVAAQTGARFVVVPVLERKGDAWLARMEVRSVDTGTAVGGEQTDALSSSLPKDAAYRLVASLGDRVQDYFRLHGPGQSYRPRSAGSRFQSLEAARSFEQGMRAYGQLEYAEALSQLQRSAEVDGEHALTHAWLSRLLLILGRGSDALASARRAKQLAAPDLAARDSGFVDAVLAESQKDPATEDRYRSLMLLTGDDVAARVELADFLKRQGRNQPAVEEFHAVLGLDAGYTRPHVDLCQLYTRIQERPLAEQHARTALERFRAAGDRGGEAQALLCLGEAQRLQGGEQLAEARRNIETARDILASLGQVYGLSRAYNYLGNVAESERNYQGAMQFFDEALTRSRQVGNRELEGVLLMNLGVEQYRLGAGSQALTFFDKSREVYEQLGDERSAAEQVVNAATLRVEYGQDQAKALADVATARATLERLGHVEFDVLAMSVQARGSRYAGRPQEARRQLLAALSIATERKLGEKAASLNLDVATIDIVLNDYEAARARLELLAATVPAPGDPANEIALGTVYAKLGDFGTSRQHLERAMAGIESSGQKLLVPAVHLAFGELEYESGSVSAARGHFERAAAAWADDLPNAESVEARSYLALLDALGRRGSTARAQAQASVGRAGSMGRSDLEAQCRLRLARVQLNERRGDEALATLNEIPVEGERAVSRELAAETRYWRSRALADRGDRAASRIEADAARTQMASLQASLPEKYRDLFAGRADIREVIGQNTR